MKSRKSNIAGVNLIEIMVVVVIIGILVAIATPRFMKINVKIKQNEAKHYLAQIKNMQEYRRQMCQQDYCLDGAIASAKNSDGFNEICVSIDSTACYTYVMTANEYRFTCVASANIDRDSTIDQWVISSDDTLRCITNDVWQ